MNGRPRGCRRRVDKYLAKTDRRAYPVECITKASPARVTESGNGWLQLIRRREQAEPEATPTTALDFPQPVRPLQNLPRLLPSGGHDRSRCHYPISGRRTVPKPQSRCNVDVDAFPFAEPGARLLVRRICLRWTAPFPASPSLGRRDQGSSGSTGCLLDSRNRPRPGSPSPHERPVPREAASLHGPAGRRACRLYPSRCSDPITSRIVRLSTGVAQAKLMARGKIRP